MKERSATESLEGNFVTARFRTQNEAGFGDAARPPAGSWLVRPPVRATSALVVARWALIGLALLGLLKPHAVAQRLFIARDDLAVREVERMYQRGLQFLARTQRPDGTWPDPTYGAYPAVVSLAVLSFLAYGHDPNHGVHAPVIRRGVEYVLSRQDARTGYIGDSMYHHGFSTLMLAEAYGALYDPRLGSALQKAVQLILDAQRRNPNGAWRYSPESTDADTTVTGAQMVALYAARNAGLAVPEEALQSGLRFFLSRQVANSGFGYTTPNDPNAARTAIGCTVLALAREKDGAPFQAAFTFLKATPPDPAHPQYYLYYASQAFFHASPDEWQAWNAKNIRALAQSQGADGSWSGQYGPTFGTAMTLLSLALNYRYLPIYER